MSSPRDLRKELVEASLGLLADHGPDALQARRVAAACDTSTMSVYTHFGGMKQLIAALADEGFRRLAKELKRVEPSDDPLADIVAQSLLYRQYARVNPHLFRLMFAMTTVHGISAPVYNAFSLPTGHEQSAELKLLAVLLGVVQRAVDAEQLAGDPLVLLCQFWSALHGYVVLELTGYFGVGDDGLFSVLYPLGASVLAGPGGSQQRVHAAQERATQTVLALLQGAEV